MMRMKTVDSEVLAALISAATGKPAFKASEDMLYLAALIVEHCASIADSTEREDAPNVRQLKAGEQIRAEWGLG